LAIASLLSIGGLINDRLITYPRKNLAIADLPAAWQRKKIAQLSDLHLNSAETSRLPQIAARLNQENLAALFITGDFFDGSDKNLAKLAQPLASIKTDYGTYFVTGNHESYMDTKKAVAVLESLGVIVLDDKKINLGGIEIAGLSYAQPGKTANIEERLENLDLKKPSILLYHEPRGVKKLAKNDQISLAFFGHTHNGQLWPFNLIVRLIYGRFANGLQTENRLITYTSAGAGSWGPPMRTNSHPEVAIFELLAN
jgi:predicted MPP superfamily phosphohydrolase